MKPLDHRRLVENLDAFRPLASGELFHRIGGQGAIDRLVDGLYDGIEGDPGIRFLFNSDLTRERVRQKAFFSEWLGGEGGYSNLAYMTVKQKHDPLHLTHDLAGRWLGHFRRALETAVDMEADRQIIYGRARLLASSLVNEAAPAAAQRGSGHHCERAFRRADELARKGDIAGFRELLRAAPELLHRVTRRGRLLHTALLHGRVELVQLLLELGINANQPSPLEGHALTGVIYLTPICVARLKKRPVLEELLLKHGAVGDIFTAAFLGAEADLARELDAGPSLAQARDPACDSIAITPLHHAVAGGHPAALRCLLERGADARLNGVRALHDAAAAGSVEMAALLIQHGASARGIGPGRWVLHPELAELLSLAGADARDPENRWVWISCCGNNSQRDDPLFVRALLQRGARVDDRFLGATPLHYAVKAGFLATIPVLLERGADMAALDEEGRTPLDWLERAGKSVEREAVRRALRKIADGRSLN